MAPSTPSTHTGAVLHDAAADPHAQVDALLGTVAAMPAELWPAHPETPAARVAFAAGLRALADSIAPA